MLNQSGVQDRDAKVHNSVQLCMRVDLIYDSSCGEQEPFRTAGAQALVCNGWQASAWDIITHED
jgi:hypothetical protein